MGELIGEELIGEAAEAGLLISVTSDTVIRIVPLFWVRALGGALYITGVFIGGQSRAFGGR